MSEEEKQNINKRLRERVNKAMQNKQTKQQEQMTPVGLKGFRKTETAYIKAL